MLDMYKRHYDVRARRSQGTGVWLIETPEFKSWFENHALEGFRVLLGVGDPGAGKTFILYAFSLDILLTLTVPKLILDRLSIWCLWQRPNWVGLYLL